MAKTTEIKQKTAETVAKVVHSSTKSLKNIGYKIAKHVDQWLAQYQDWTFNEVVIKLKRIRLQAPLEKKLVARVVAEITQQATCERVAQSDVAWVGDIKVLVTYPESQMKILDADKLLDEHPDLFMQDFNMVKLQAHKEALLTLMPDVFHLVPNMPLVELKAASMTKAQRKKHFVQVAQTPRVTVK